MTRSSRKSASSNVTYVLSWTFCAFIILISKFSFLSDCIRPDLLNGPRPPEAKSRKRVKKKKFVFVRESVFTEKLRRKVLSSLLLFKNTKWRTKTHGTYEIKILLFKKLIVAWKYRESKFFYIFLLLSTFNIIRFGMPVEVSSPSHLLSICIVCPLRIRPKWANFVATCGQLCEPSLRSKLKNNRLDRLAREQSFSSFKMCL